MREYDRPETLIGQTVKGSTPYGNIYVTINKDKYDNPIEIFITIGKAGSDLSANAECIARLISMSLQCAKPEIRLSLLQMICEEMSDIGGPRKTGFGNNVIKSLPDAVGKIIAGEVFSQSLKGA